MPILYATLHIPLHFNQADLDSDPLVQQHRVILEAKDGHAIWVNSKVLEEISPLPESVEGGVIIRDAFGQPTGDRTGIHP
jgi:predicted amidohydrolase YtcJ